MYYKNTETPGRDHRAEGRCDIDSDPGKLNIPKKMNALNVFFFLGFFSTISSPVRADDFAPRIIEHPQNTIVRQGDPATLNCIVEGRPEPELTWIKDGESIEELLDDTIAGDDRPLVSAVSGPIGDLQQLFFLRVNRPYVGSYQCVATNRLGHAKSHNATLELYVTCPSGWHKHEDTCFSLNSSPKREYEDAATDCANQGAALASIHSIEEQRFLADLLESGKSYYIGLADIILEDTFKWADGTPLDFTYYDDGQPNEDGSQDCILMTRNSAERKWNDYKCDASLSYICRMNLANDTELPNWRNDGRCGPRYIAPNGKEGECPLACCSWNYYCGTTMEHCNGAYLHKDYRKCPVLTKPDYVKAWEEPDNSFGAVATFDCIPGFLRQGSASRTCQTDGTWSGEEAVCVQKGGIQIDLVEGDATITRGGIFDKLEVNRNVGEVTLACKFDSIQSQPPVFTANGQNYSMTETVAGLEWIVTVDLDKDDSYLCSTQDNEVLLEVDVRVDVYIELVQGRGNLTRGTLGNYELRVFPGETIMLSCAPEFVLGGYVWKREPSTVLYSSGGDYILAESDPYFDRLKFEPQSPSRWDEVWMMRLRDLALNEGISFSCSSPSYGQTTVNLTVTYDVTEAIEMAVDGVKKLSPDQETITVDFGLCGVAPPNSMWVSSEDYCYLLDTDELTMDNAEAKCRELGSELSSIHSESEQKLHADLMSELQVFDAWIGLNDRNIEGDFVYNDGTPMDFTFWASGEPNNAGNEDCVHLKSTVEHKWNDVPCTGVMDFFCKKSKGVGDISSSADTTISCTFYGQNPAGVVTWYKDNEELHEPEYSLQEYIPGRVYKLIATKGLSNGGEYRCVAEDGRAQSLRLNIEVSVTVSLGDGRGKFTRGLNAARSTLTAVTGQNITITCRADVMPTEPTLTWQRSPFGAEQFTEISAMDINDGSIIFTQDLDNNEWSMTLVEISELDQGVYSCEMYGDSDDIALGKDTLYVTVFAAAEEGLDIALTTEVDGLTTWLRRDENAMIVDEGVGRITLTCRTSFWADSIIWRDDYGRDLTYDSSNYEIIETIPGWEKTMSFEYKGRYLSDGEYSCDASDSTKGSSKKRIFTIYNAVIFNIKLTEGRGQYIETPEKTIITAFKGETISLTCSFKYNANEFQYFKWKIGSENYRSPSYYVSSYSIQHGRLSFNDNNDLKESTLTLADLTKEDENEYGCEKSDEGPSVVHLVVADEADTCEFECYPGTGAWDNNCIAANETCNVETDCDNLRDEADCPDLGCLGLNPPANGTLEATSFTLGSVVSYSCKPGYKLEGTETRMCQDSGQWTGEQPSCKLNTFDGCPRLTKPQDGIHFDTGNNVGDTNHFECTPGYRLKGSLSRICQDNGNWTGEPTICENANLGSTTAQINLVRGTGKVERYLFEYGGDLETVEHTVITVDSNVGSLTFSCRLPTRSRPPYWRPNGIGTYGNVAEQIGDYSISEIVEGFEWTLTMGIGEGGPIGPESQTKWNCYARDPKSYDAYFRVDVLGDQPFADLDSTKVVATLSDGIGIVEIIEQPDGDSITNIQVEPRSTISIICNVTTVDSIASRDMYQRWGKDKDWGSEYSDLISWDDYKYSDDPKISIKEDRKNLDWTLTVTDLTEDYNGTIHCLIRPDTFTSREVILATVNIKVEELPKYRDDNKCGPGNLAPSGKEAICPGECCSTDGLCGDTEDFCVTNLYKDYRNPCKTDQSSSDEWVNLSDYCYHLGNEELSFSDAEEKCLELGAQLSSIHSEDEQELHASLMSESNVNSAWIGLNDRDYEGSFVYIDGTPVDMTFWASGEPSSYYNEDCVQLKPGDGEWNDLQCTDRMGYFCKRHLGAPGLSRCPSGWYKYENKCFQLNHEPKVTFKQASKECSNRNSTLASIHSLEEQQLVADLLYLDRSYYIGLNDIDMEETFVWADGTPLDYTFWARKQPNHGDSQHCAVLWKDDDERKWNDYKCNKKLGYICGKQSEVDQLLPSSTTLPEPQATTLGSDGGQLVPNPTLAPELEVPTSADDIEITLSEGQGFEKVITVPGVGTFKNILVPRGDRIALTCKVAIDGAQNIVWTHENNIISYGGVLAVASGNIQIKENLNEQEWTVTLSEVSQSDEGQWICANQVVGGGISAAIANLTISDSPIVPKEETGDMEAMKSARTCEQITDDNLNICSDLTYDLTTMPNMFGHKTQAEVSMAFGILQTIPDNLCPIRELACSTHLPPCKDLDSVSVPIPPCRWICEEAAAQCGSSIPWPPVPELDCNRFPDNDASYSRCWEPTNGIFGDNLPCEKVPSPLCRNLGFRHTKFPNALKHQTAEEAMIAFQDESIQKLIDAGCSDELAPFVCGAFFPSCDDNTVIPVCYEVCRTTWKDCKSTVSQLGIEKNEVFSCGKRYPSAEDGEAGLTCLIDITPPSEAPVLSGIKRLPTAMEFTAGTDDTDIDVFEATAYAVSVPESYPASTTTVAAVTQGSKMQSKIVLGSSRNKRQAVASGPLASSPLDPDTSYFIVVQSKNQYGYSPISAITLPKYNAESVDIPLDDVESVDYDLIPEEGLTFFKMRNNPKQAVCVNLLTDSKPVWMDENGTYTQTEFVWSKTSNLISRMTVLELIGEPIRGPYQCAKDLSSQGLITVDFKTTCFESEHFICKAFSSYTYLPNFFGHVDLQTAELASYEFLPLLQASCLNTTDLAKFVCAIYAPGGSCETSGSSESPVAPCKEVCLKVQEDSRLCGQTIGFTWPGVASCEGLPSLDEGMCDDLGLLGDMMQMAQNRTLPAPGLTANESSIPQEMCDIRPRRYDVVDLGKDCYFRGWADVQGQGASNDYCRVVYTGGQEFLSCALAGTAGESEYNFNSPNASDVWLAVGHEDTWYMKDEDGDGKDDYCRCVGKLPETFMSCMKSGETGFVGLYDFTPPNATPNCHTTKVNPYFGTP